MRLTQKIAGSVLLAGALMGGLAVHDARAVFTAHSQAYHPVNGYPLWYQSAGGVQLELCTDPNNALCLADPAIAGNAFSQTTGFGAEAFYWNGTNIMPLASGGSADLVLGLEATYLGGDPVNGDQMIFTRVRIRVDAPIAGTYVVTHPFGQKTYNVTTPGAVAINDTIDIGAVAIKDLPTAYDLALNGNIGPFLTAVAPAAPAGYIGDPGVEQTVTGSPTGDNFFRVEGPAGSNLGGVGIDSIQKDTFNLSGKLFGVPGITANTLTTNNATPTLTGTVSDPTATVSVTVDGQTINATNVGDGTWTAAVPVALIDGTYDIVATATPTAGSPGTATLTGGLVIDTVLPIITGVNEGQVLTTAPAPTFNEGTGTLNGAAYTSGTSISVNGAYALVVADAAGNSTTVNFEVNIPAVVLTATVNPIITNDNTPVITGTVSDPNATISVTVDGQTVAGTNAGDGTWSATIPVSLNNGTFDAVVIATPTAGAPVTATETGGIVIDTVPPAVIGVSDGQVLTSPISPTFNEGTATLDGGPYTSGTSIASGGAHVLVITDPAGNVTTINFQLNVSSIATISVTPANAAVITGQTQQFTAEARDGNGSAINPQPAFTWNVSDNTVGTIDTNGLFTAVHSGNVTVTASSGGVDGSISARVDDQPNPVLTTISVTPASPSIAIGATQQFTASALDQNGAAINPQPAFTWTSGTPATGTIDANGLFTAVATGNSIITVDGGGISGTATITVQAGNPAPDPGNGGGGNGGSGGGSSGSNNGNSGSNSDGGNDNQNADKGKPEIKEVKQVIVPAGKSSKKTTVAITWKTGAPSVSRVFYVTGKKPGNLNTANFGAILDGKSKLPKGVKIVNEIKANLSEITESDLRTDHTVNIPGIKKNKTVYFVIVTQRPDGTERVVSEMQALR